MNMQRIRLHRIARDERGVSAVEMGLIIPFLTALTIGIIDLSNALATRFMLHNAVHSGLELVAANTLSVGAEVTKIDFSFVEKKVSEMSGVPQEDVEATTWLECDGEEQPDFNGTCAEGQVMARYLQVRAEKLPEPMFDTSIIGINKNTPLFAEAAVRIQ